MATVTKAETKKMYSWWWDSHVSPKNSKWLQDNLTDMDAKVKLMIKLIEVDDDSFAKRAEMYYKKRPELMKLVEEFYRAFRALAERYDHATGVIKQAHKTMAEAFPSQNPFIEPDESVFREEISFPNVKEEVSFHDVQKKLGVMENLVEQKAILEHSFSKLSFELLMYEKSIANAKKATLSSQSDIIIENLEKLSARNSCLEDSLLDKNSEIEALKKASKDLENQDNSLAVSSQFEICILQGVLRDLKETNLSLLNKYEKLFKTSKLSEELILELEHENIDQHEEVKFMSEQVRRLRMGMFQLLNVLDIDLELVCEDSFEGDRIVLHHILTKLDDTRGFFCEVWHENQKLLIEKSDLEKLLGQLRHELSDLKPAIKIGNDKLSSLQKDMHKLLEMQDEKSGDLMEKRSLIEAIARLYDENNSCLVVNGVSLDSLLLIFKSIGLERTEIVNQLACNSYEVATMASAVHKCQAENTDLKGELKEVKSENIQLMLEIARKKEQLSQKEMEFSEAVTVNIDQGKQISELSERYEKQLKESESLRESMELVQSELKKSRVEAELWETIAGTSFSELQISSVREALFEEKFSELSQEYESLEDENHSKDLELVQFKESMESLEGENSRINTQLAGHVQALATLRDSIASLESHTTHTGFENEKDSASLQEPSKDVVVTSPTLDDISNFLDIATRIKAVQAKVIEAKKPSKDSRSRRGSGRLNKHIASESSESQSSKGHHHHHHLHHHLTGDDHILELWETMDQSGNIDLTVENNIKILDRIASDVQKLTNLEITVQDLQQKVMVTESSSPGIEYVRVKHQLDEAERAIAKLIGLSGRLMKNAEECSPNVPSIVDETSEIGRKRKVMEQARRCQEKIGRLQMEVQKIQFMLVKIDGDSKTTHRSGARVSERSNRILLKDFLYANSRTTPRRKKGQLCGCIPTSGD